MLQNYIQTFRYLFKNWYYSLLNIIGFSSGLTVSLLLFIYCFHELNIDSSHKNANQIYLLRMDYLSNGSVVFGLYTPSPIYDILKHDYKEIKYSSRTYPEDVRIKRNDNIFKTKGILRVDPDFFNLFSFKIVKGKSDFLFKNYERILISKNIANNFFENINPVGKTIELSNGKEYVVSGVIETSESNSSFQFDFITSTTKVDSLSWKFSETPPTYYKVETVEQVSHITNLVQKKIDEVYGKDLYKVESVPLREQYFHQGLTFLRHGNKIYINIFFTIGAIILLISIINYANLSTAQVVRRSKEIAVRKVMGASIWRLLLEHLLELSALLLISFLIASSAVYYLLPSFAQLIGNDVNLDFFSLTEIVGFCLVLFIIVMILSLLYPIWQMSRMNPVVAMKNEVVQYKWAVPVRKGLIIFQFIISMSLITCTLILQSQLNFLVTQNLGFDKNQILSLRIDPSNQLVTKNYSSFKNELLQHTSVRGVTVSPMPDFDFEMEGAYEEDDGQEASTKAYLFKVDDDFIQVMDLQIIEGNTFDKNNPKEGIIINQTAAKLFFEGDAIGKENKAISKKKVIGVVKDFHYAGMRNKIYPLILEHYNKKVKNIQIKISTENVQETISKINLIWKKYFPDQVYEYHFLSDEYEKLYESETRIARGFTVFSLASVVIGCLGLIGLASYVLNNKRKEISIRIVFGASIVDVLIVLIWYFLFPIILSIGISIPLVYWSMSNYLDDFVYRIQISPWYFMIGACITAFLVIASIGLLCFRAASTNPISNIRNE